MTRTYITIGLVIALLVAFVMTYREGKSAGITQTEAFYQLRMNESISAMQQMMAKQRSESRAAMSEKEKDIEAARAQAQQAWEKLGKSNAQLQKCLAVDVPVSAIWVQQ
jgi:ABC-type transport system involved in cytochrome bd biosynthesis fused ATPase/permease subunit